MYCNSATNLPFPSVSSRLKKSLGFTSWPANSRGKEVIYHVLAQFHLQNPRGEHKHEGEFEQTSLGLARRHLPRDEPILTLPLLLWPGIRRRKTNTSTRTGSILTSNVPTTHTAGCNQGVASKYYYLTP